MSNYNDMLNQFLTTNPKTVNGLQNNSYFYYRNQLYNKIFSLFTFNNVPDYWDIDYLKNTLFKGGYIPVVLYNGQPWALRGAYSGINIYGNPTEIMINNPVVGSFSRTIGVDGELLYFNKVDNGYLGLEPLVKRYALLLAQCDASINTTLMNSRVRHIFEGENDAEIKSYMKVYDDVSRGKPRVFIKKGANAMKESNFNFLNVKNTYIGNDIIITKRSIINEFLTEIGIANANTDKRERLTNDEIRSNNGETTANISLWKDTLNRCFSRINRLFGTNITVSFNYETVTETVNNGGVNNELD